jgi:mannose-1-phosphate guanylyltransferase/mannose-6-phosphate isomerase
MNAPTIHPVLLCGGSGTRLWPLSRKALPKQFAPLVGNKSLLQLTLERLSGLNRTITCVASEDHRFLVREAMDNAQAQGRQILEPMPRNTAGAMAAAALLADPDDLLLFAPADHHIPDAALFAATVRSGVEAALAGRIVTFGVTPSFPSTAYGYIEAAGPTGHGASHAVARFVEKPTAAVAESLILQGSYCWNAGIFLVQARALVAALRTHAPDILAACERATAAHSVDGSFVRLDREAFEGCRSESIDYAVLEKHTDVAVVRFEGAWSDVGSWNAVAQLHPADEAGNRLSGGMASVLQFAQHLRACAAPAGGGAGHRGPDHRGHARRRAGGRRGLRRAGGRGRAHAGHARARPWPPNTAAWCGPGAPTTAWTRASASR